MATFVLVHGAWHGSWCWKKMVPLLEAAGHTVVTPDLPSHGDDPTPLAEIGADAYRDRIKEVLEAQPEPVILVGHSMGGLVISAGAEACPEKVATLVYLAALLPSPGMQNIDVGASPEVMAAMLPEADGLGLKFDPRLVRSVFYADCSDDDVAFAQERLCLQPTAAMGAPPKLSVERFGSVSRHYIECTEDAALPVEGQRKQYAASPCENVYTLDSSHSPFFSLPESTCSILEKIAAGLG